MRVISRMGGTSQGRPRSSSVYRGERRGCANAEEKRGNTYIFCHQSTVNP